MKLYPLLSVALLLAGLARPSAAAEEKIPATQPVPRLQSYSWMSLAQWFRFHTDDVDVAEAGESDLLFVGDSITHGWDSQPLWQEAFGKWRPANSGIGGDTTSNVLWRLEHGGIGKLAPKVVVVMIGTNNFWVNHNEPAEVADGISAVVALLRDSFPAAKILVLSVFPRDEFPDGENRVKVEEVNRHLPALDDGEHVFVRDIGDVFLEPDGHLTKEIMPDFLHPSAEGYRRWADAILPIITPWLE